MYVVLSIGYGDSCIRFSPEGSWYCMKRTGRIPFFQSKRTFSPLYTGPNYKKNHKEILTSSNIKSLYELLEHKNDCIKMKSLTGGYCPNGSMSLFFHIVEITGSVLCAIILSSSSPYRINPQGSPLSTTSDR